MDGGDYASIVAAIVAAFSAWAVARSSSKANRLSKELETKALVESKELETAATKESIRSQAETDAYERARAFDIATIERQTAEILQVRADNVHLNSDVKRVNRENQELFNEREALRNEIRAMHDERFREREDCQKVRQQLARAVAEGRLDLEGAVDIDTHSRTKPPIEFHQGDRDVDYSEPGDSYPTD